MQTSSDHTSRLSLLHIEALQKRGLTNATIDASGFRSLTAEEVLAVLKFNPNRSAGLGIPFLHPVTGETRLVRVRPNIAPVIDGKPAKYLSPKGAGNLLYFPPGCADRLKDPTEPLYITEGEFKTLAAWQAGLLTVGMIGVWGWRGKGLNGHSQPIFDLDLVGWRERTVVIVFDSDVAINPEVQRARQALAHEAYRRGARIVCTINLPAPDGIKVGWDDYLLAHGLDAFSDLDAEEIPAPFPVVKLITGLELQNTQIERPPAIVPGWGIRKNGKGILCGMGGRGKSTLLLQLACDLAAGKPLLGHPQLAVASPQNVAIFMAEDPLSETKFRWEQQMKALSYGDEVARRIAFLDPQGQRIMLTDEYAWMALFDALRRHHSTVAFLDPLVGLHDAEENNNSAMRYVLDLLSPFQEETGCAFLIAHHEPKSPESNGAAARGASAIRDWCRTMLRLTSHSDDEDQVRRYSLILDKCNYGGTAWNLTLERKRDSYIFTSAPEQGAVTPLQMWETIGSEQRWFSDVLQELVSKYKTSKTTAARAVKRAQELGLAEVGEETNPQSGRQKKTIVHGKGKSTDEG